MYPISLVDDIQVIEFKGPWQTKSKGSLSVLLALPVELIENFLKYKAYLPFDEVPEKLKGLRLYLVSDIPSGNIGGGEYHKIRQEIIFVLKGEVLIICEDLKSGKVEYELHFGQGIWLPSLILHTYKALEPSDLLVFANTLYDVEDPETHDTYSEIIFRDRHNFRQWADDLLLDFVNKLAS